MDDATPSLGFSWRPPSRSSSAEARPSLSSLSIAHPAQRVEVSWQGSTAFGAPIMEHYDGTSLDAACRSLGDILEQHGWARRITQQTPAMLCICYFHPETQCEAHVTARITRCAGHDC